MTAAYAARKSGGAVGSATVGWDQVGGSAGDTQLLFLSTLYLGQVTDSAAALAWMAAHIEGLGDGWTVLGYRSQDNDDTFWWTDVTSLVAVRTMDGTESSANRPVLSYDGYAPVAVLIRHGYSLVRLTDATLAGADLTQTSASSTQAANGAVTLPTDGCVVAELVTAWDAGDTPTAPAGYTGATSWTYSTAGRAKLAYQNAMTAGAVAGINWTGTYDDSRYWLTSTVAFGTPGSTLEHGVARAAGRALTTPAKARTYLGIPDDRTFLEPVNFPPAAEPGIDPPGAPYVVPDSGPYRPGG